VVRFFEAGEDDGAVVATHETILVGLVDVGGGRVAVASAGDDVRVLDLSGTGPAGQNEPADDTAPLQRGEVGLAEHEAASAASASASASAAVDEDGLSHGGAAEHKESASVALSADDAAAVQEEGDLGLGEPGSDGVDDASSSAQAEPAAAARVVCQRLLSDGVLSVVALPGGHMAAASADGSIAVLRGADLEIVSSLPGGRGAVHAMAETHDGRLLAAYEDGSTLVWGFLGPEADSQSVLAAKQGTPIPAPSGAALALRLSDVEAAPRLGSGASAGKAEA